MVEITCYTLLYDTLTLRLIYTRYIYIIPGIYYCRYTKYSIGHHIAGSTFIEMSNFRCTVSAVEFGYISYRTPHLRYLSYRTNILQLSGYSIGYHMEYFDIYRNLELSIHRIDRWIGIHRIERRTFDMISHQTRLSSIPWHLRFVLADSERFFSTYRLRLCTSNKIEVVATTAIHCIEIVSVVFIVCPYRIEFYSRSTSDACYEHILAKPFLPDGALHPYIRNCPISLDFVPFVCYEQHLGHEIDCSSGLHVYFPPKEALGGV